MRKIIAVLACLAVSALTACGSSSSSGGQGGSKESLSLLTFPGDYYFTDYVASHEGMFAKHNLDVRFVTPQNGVSAVQEVLSGSLDGVINDGPLSVLTASKGQDLKVIGSVYNENPWNVYLSDKAKGAPSGTSFPANLQALKGDRIGVTGLGAGSDLALSAALNSAGMADNSVRHVAIGLQQAALGQFGAGNLDAYVSTEPGSVFFSQNKVAHEYLSFAQTLPSSLAHYAEGMIVVNGKWLSSHASTARDYVAAEEEAAKWVTDTANAKAAQALFAKDYNINESAAAAQVTRLAAIYRQNLPGLGVSEQLWNNTASVLVRAGVITSNKVAAYKQVVASSAQAKSNG